MITDYATLQTSIAGFLHRSDLTTIIPEFIADAELRIYDELRLKCMEAAFTGTIAAGVVANPASFLEWIYVYIDGSNTTKLQIKDSEWIYTNYPDRSSGGTPKFAAPEGDNLIFGPYPNSTYTVKGRYYKKLAALSVSNTTNWFIENAPNLLRYGALCEAAPYLGNDQRIPVWEQKFNAIKSRLQKTDKRGAFGGSQLSMTGG
jgi:hypothetical protein